MARPKIKLDSAGLREFLRGPGVQALVNATAESVAEDLHSRLEGRSFTDVDFSIRLTDRAVGVVEIPGYNAGLYQSRDGILTRAAARHGLKPWRGR